MKITYTAPNRAHHYPYAAAINSAESLQAFVSGFSRFSPRASLPSIGDKLKRHDFFQNLYLASCKFNAPYFIRSAFNQLSNSRLDQASYKWAKKSDAFIYYRTQGFQTVKRLKKEGAHTLCVMEEVNSHIDVCTSLMKEEFEKLNLGPYRERFPDHSLRLKAYEQADYILCPSQFVKRSFIEKGFNESKLIKINFGFPAIETGVTGIVAKDNKFRLLYVGQLHYRKGLRYAIEAFRLLKHPHKEFIIVGPKTEVTGLEGINMPEGVVFTGVLKGDELSQQYRLADVFVLPSVEEGLALVQGEALSFGVPLLVTTNTGGDDLITDGVNGFVVPPSDVEALYEKLQVMADDRSLLEEMSAAALLSAKKLGDWGATAEILISTLQQLQRNIV